MITLDRDLTWSLPHKSQSVTHCCMSTSILIHRIHNDHSAEHDPWRCNYDPLLSDAIVVTPGPTFMDLAALWEHVPHLLDVCVCDNIPVMRNLRLIRKEASKEASVALLGLRSFTLMLKGIDGYQTVSGASLLRSTQLRKLDVHLLMSGVGSNCMTSGHTFTRFTNDCMEWHTATISSGSDY